MKDIEKFLDSISVKLTKKSITRCRLQTILKRSGGYTKRGTKFIKKFNTTLNDKGLITSPILTINTPRLKDDWVYFKYNSNVETANNVISQKTKEFFKMNKKFIPYPHQTEAWNNMDKHYLDKNFKRGMVVVPTGGGKTTIATKWLIDKYLNNGYRILWFAHRVELLEQAKDTFLNFSYLNNKLDDNTMSIISSQNDSWKSVFNDQLAVFSTEKSAARSLNCIENMISESKNGVFVVVDECHHSVAPEYQKILKTLFNYKGGKDVKLLGITATPKRMNPNETHVLWKIFDDNYSIDKINSATATSDEYNSKIYEISQAELIHKGILAKPIPLTIKTNLEFESDFTDKDYEYLQQFGELAPKVLDRLAKSSLRNEKIVKHYKENIDKYGKTIVFAIDIMHCKTLQDEFDKVGIDCDYVAYGKSDNSEIIDNFKTSKSPMVLISVIKLTEGFDAPNIQTVFITRPTRSEVLLRQMVGRGLRGPAAGGTEECFLVTFVDTWEIFQPINSDYVISPEDTTDISPKPYNTSELIPISDKLIDVAYKMLKDKATVDIDSIHKALPYAWYQWTETTEDDEIENLIMIFETQYKEYENLRIYYENNKNSIPKIIGSEFLNNLMVNYFCDCPDPLPNKSDFLLLLSAIKKGITINSFLFEEKEQFNPRILAEKCEELRRFELEDKLTEIFESNELCRKIYKNIFQNFYEEVSREIDRRIFARRKHKETPIEEPKSLKNKATLRSWDSYGYDLNLLANSIVYKDNGEINKLLFPNGEPPKYSISYTDKEVKTYFGIYRYSNRTIKINKLLNSPDIPRFVVEFVLYHEILHADMPNNGHDASFRERERKFIPSEEAIKDAENFGYSFDDNISYYWYTKANQFLYSLEKKYDINIFNE